ncbi:MAG: glutamyl-tRNA reductase [Desulfobacterales bacterium]
MLHPMLDIVLIGLNHKTAPVELRECIALNSDESHLALDSFKGHPAIREVVLFSTCNRVEILMTSPDPPAAISMAKAYLADSKQIQLSRFEKNLYQYTGDDAIRHLFRVAASLDSMMVGEPQVLGQIKEAYLQATREKTTGVILNRLLHRSFFVAKRVRSETGIGDRAVSISYAAIELGRRIFDTLEDKKVLLVGAGEMAELAVEHLIRRRCGEIWVANRTFERAVKLAEKFKGSAVRFEKIPHSLQFADIIISSTGAPGYVIAPVHVKGIMRQRRNRPLFFIDIAVPRDIDPELNRLANVYLYDIDDLQGVIEDNLAGRRQEASKGEQIVQEAVENFREWFASLDVVPTIVDLRSKIETIAEAEIQRTLATSLQHLSDPERDAIQRMKHALVNKILHDPTLFLKSNGCRGDKSVYLDTARKLFKLDA